MTIRRIRDGVRAKNLQATILFVDFTKAFDSIHRGKMEQILLAYGQPKETVAAIMILYRNTKAKVFSPDVDTDYFDIFFLARLLYYKANLILAYPHVSEQGRMFLNIFYRII